MRLRYRFLMRRGGAYWFAVQPADAPYLPGHSHGWRSVPVAEFWGVAS